MNSNDREPLVRHVDEVTVAVLKRVGRDEGRTSDPPERGPACLDDNVIASYLDGLLSPAERRAVEEHLSTCEYCRALVLETSETLEELDAPAEPRADGHAPQPLPFPGKRRGMWPVVGVLAAAAVVLLLFRDPLLDVLGLGRAGARATAQAALVAAVANHRTFEPRLSGGYPYARVQGVMRSGASSPTLSPDETIATARIAELAERDPSPETRALFGASLLIAGDVERAITELAAASQAAPTNAAILSDLSAAYLVRAERRGLDADYVAAFTTASRAVQLAPTLPEARFNYALAMRRGSADPHVQVRKAWEEYLTLDASSLWADEARRHLTDPTQNP